MNEVRKTSYILLFCISIMITACERKSDVYLESYISSESGEIETEDVTSIDIENGSTVVTDTDKTEGPDLEKLVYVYVCGAVICPKVYALPEGSRICDAINMAGGLRDDADALSVNQAELLTDGQMLRIYTYEEVLSGIAGKDAATDMNGSEGMSSDNFFDEKADRININTASKGQLMTLPGIGSAKAEAIIAYRTEYGAFQSVDALMKIPGIKEGILEQIREYIRIE